MRDAAWQKETNFCAKILTSSSESFLQHAKSFLACRSWLVSAGVEYISQIISLSVNLSVSSAINQPDQWNAQPSIIACIQIFWENIVTCHTQCDSLAAYFFCSAHLLAVLSAVSLIQSLEGLSFTACQAGSLLTPLAVKWTAVRMLRVSCVGCFEWNVCFMYSWRELFFVVHCNLSIMYQWLPNKLILYLTILEDVH